MAWTAPMSAVTNATWTAAEFNAHVRDNLLETMPGKATVGSQWYVSNGVNSIVERNPSSATVATSQTTTSTTYADLATVGPAVTVTTGTSAIVWWTAFHDNSAGTGQQVWSSVAVSGATTIAADDKWSVLTDGVAAGDALRLSRSFFFDTLTPGSNTFTMKYRTTTGTGTWKDRHILVFPL